MFADVDELLQVRVQVLQDEDLTVLTQIRCYARNSLFTIQEWLIY